MFKVFPHLQKIKYTNKLLDLSKIIHVNLNNITDLIFKNELLKLKNNLVFDNGNDLVFNYNKDLKDEEYQIEINESQIIISYQTLSSAWWSIQTLKQLFINQVIDTGIIVDYPDLQVRGLMIDISRDKVPTLETLKKIVDDMTCLKFNHLELYVEGFTFEYQSFKELIDKDHNYITIEEINELEKYCNERFIDLVPNENGFGHMAPWLKKENGFNHLAECPDGAIYWGSKRIAATLDPSNPDSFELVKKLYQDMIPHFKSKYFNMDFDEPMELGMGKSKEIVEKNGIQNVYLDFLTKCVNEIKNTYHKIPMCWGDVLIKHPDSFDKIPKDLIFLDWGYDHTYNFREHAKNLKEHNIKFILAPGTSTWACVTGKYLDMYGSIVNSSQACKEFQGLGLLITDWGDFGHLQYLPFSYAGFILGLCKAWSNIEEDEIKDAMNLFFKPYQTECLLTLAHIHELEGTFPSYGSRIFAPIMYAELLNNYQNGEVDPLEFVLGKLKYNPIDSFHEKVLNQELERILEKINPFSEELVDQEIINSIYLLKSLISISNHLINLNGNITQDMKNLENYSLKHQTLWCLRNKKTGFKLSNSKILNLNHILEEVKRRENI